MAGSLGVEPSLTDLETIVPPLGKPLLMVQVLGIEPRDGVWKTPMLPLHHTCVLFFGRDDRIRTDNPRLIRLAALTIELHPYKLLCNLSLLLLLESGAGVEPALTG